MTKLHEYLGSIVSSVASARMLSDIQTVELAKEYSKHPLLKHFSVARMRIEGVELTIPIGLEEGEAKTETSLDAIEPSRLTKQIHAAVLTALKLQKVPRQFASSLQAEIERQVQIVEGNVRAMGDVSPVAGFANYLAEFTMKAATKSDLKAATERDRAVEEVRQAILSAVEPEFRFTTKTLPTKDLNVVFESHRLRDFKPESLVQVKLRISEEGMEWNRTEVDGAVESRLIPE